MERIPEGQVIAAAPDVQRYNRVMGRGLMMQEYRRLARHAVSLVAADRPVQALDVGTGPGFVAIQVAHLLPPGSTVTGLDLSQEMLAAAAENAQCAGVGGHTRWQFGNAAEMPFPDDHFDLLTSSGSLHHWEKPQAIFNEIARVLKPCGALLVRDSKRLQGDWPQTFARLIGWTIPTDFRVHYWNSIWSSYTAVELEAILSQSDLKGWRIEQDIMDLMVIIGEER